jgi:hypothetical protein
MNLRSGRRPGDAAETVFLDGRQHEGLPSIKSTAPQTRLAATVSSCKQALNQIGAPLRRKLQKSLATSLVHCPQQPGAAPIAQMIGCVPPDERRCCTKRRKGRKRPRERLDIVAADHHDGSRAGVGSGQAAWHQRIDDLYVAQAFRRLSGQRRAAAEQLEAENARLKKLVAERDLEIEVMKEVAAKNW